MSIPFFLTQDDLTKRKISSSRQQTDYLQRNCGFPHGRLLSPKVRAWTEQEIADWLASRPITGLLPIPEEKRGLGAGRPRKQPKPPPPQAA